MSTATIQPPLGADAILDDDEAMAALGWTRTSVHVGALREALRLLLGLHLDHVLSCESGDADIAAEVQRARAALADHGHEVLVGWVRWDGDGFTAFRYAHPSDGDRDARRRRELLGELPVYCRAPLAA